MHKQEAGKKLQGELFLRVARINKACRELKHRLDQLGGTKRFWWTSMARRAALKKMNQHIASVTKLQRSFEEAKHNKTLHLPSTVEHIVKKHKHALSKARCFLEKVEKLLQKHGDC
jgi:hypothetical protein